MIEFQIREAKNSDWSDIVKLYKISQNKTGIPPKNVVPFKDLERSLIKRKTIKRYVATSHNKIIGHGLIEKLDKRGAEHWNKFYTTETLNNTIYIGGAFVDPGYFRNGVYNALFETRLNAIKELYKHPISATWVQNKHVCKVFERFGGKKVSTVLFSGSKMHFYYFGEH